MNKQSETGIEWTHVFGPGTGYTWNVIGGCQHNCRWNMPDQSVAECYAKTLVDMQRSDNYYARGFQAHYFHPERLQEPLQLRKPAGIFLDSMSDLMGHWVPDEQINQVLEVCRQTPQHIYFLLTKNPPRLRKFDFPPNCWVGVSAPPSQMMGKPLTIAQQNRWFYIAINALNQCNARIKWVSFEPLSYDIALDMTLSTQYRLITTIHWAVIGAASRGKSYYQPDPAWIKGLLDVLAMRNIPAFFKGNLRGNPAADPWREEFPPFKGATRESPPTQQLSLF